MARPVLHLDFETRSAVDLKKVGAYRYAEDPSTEVICLSYRVGDGPVRHWRPGHHFNVPGGMSCAHNAGFERAIWNHKVCIGDERGHFTCEPIIVEEQDCTLARALAVGLPASLDMLGAALKAPIQKDKEGHRLMLQMCKPRKVHADGRIEWWDDEERLERLGAYCDRDVETEMGVDNRLPALSVRERSVWVLDQQVNDRGFAVDVRRVQCALAVVAEAKRRADRRTWELTNGAVSTCNQTAKIVAWIRSRGVPCDSIAKGEVEEIVLRADMFDDPVIEEVVSLRRETSRMFRFDKILAWVCRDGRIRGALQYHKAHTGRWAGWTQSFPRVDSVENVEAVLDALARFPDPSKAVNYIDLAIAPVLPALSQCLRPMVVAPPGKKLVGGDFSNIEGVTAAWFADETWKLRAFEASFAGTGPGMYEIMAAEVLGIDVSAVDRRHRQSHGKVPELACGYQGHVGAFMKMASTQNPPVRVTHAQAAAIVTGWREKNSRIVQAWWDLQDAAISAVEAKGVVIPVLGDKVRYVSDGRFLYCKLPSGRNLHYASPSVRWRSRIVKTEDGDEIELNSRGVSFWGVGFGNRWEQIDLYGGMQFNHVVQGFARDLLVEAMFAVEAAGYPIVLHTHDDLICEVDADFGSADEFETLMVEAARKMAPGLPLSVKGWEGDRWLK